jgi:hypothetical protein
MTNDQVQQQIEIIRSMIEKSRLETAESGRFFIWMGVISIVAVFTIGSLETSGLSHLVLPALIIMLVASGVVGYLAVAVRLKRERVRSYPATICYSVWLACAAPATIVTLLLPLLGVYPWNLVPVLAALLVGIAVFSSGVIFESSGVKWSALAWWGGAVAMALVHGTPRMFIMMAVILLGWILPGSVLNRVYRRRRENDDS